VPARRTLLVAALLAALSGCTSRPPVLPDATPGSPGPTTLTDPWGQLAGRVAAARDSRFVAGYTLQTRGRPARTVTVTIAGDGSWLVTIPGGALGGGADVAVAATPGGLFECTVGAPTNCYRVGSAEAALPARSDPRVHHVFTDWLQVFSNRDAAISVASAPVSSMNDPSHGSSPYPTSATKPPARRTSRATGRRAGGADGAATDTSVGTMAIANPTVLLALATLARARGSSGDVFPPRCARQSRRRPPRAGTPPRLVLHRGWIGPGSV